MASSHPTTLYLSESIEPVMPPIPEHLLTPLQWFALILAITATFGGVAFITYALRAKRHNSAAHSALGFAGITVAALVLLGMLGSPISVVYVMVIIIVTIAAAIASGVFLTIENF